MVGPGARAELPPGEVALSEREVEVLVLVARECSNEAIGQQLIISEPTVRTHVSHILEKPYLANRTQAPLYALRNGLAALDPD